MVYLEDKWKVARVQTRGSDVKIGVHYHFTELNYCYTLTPLCSDVSYDDLRLNGKKVKHLVLLFLVTVKRALGSP